MSSNTLARPAMKIVGVTVWASESTLRKVLGRTDIVGHRYYYDKVVYVRDRDTQAGHTLLLGRRVKVRYNQRRDLWEMFPG